MANAERDISDVALPLSPQAKWFEHAPGFVIVMRGPEHVVEFVNRAHRRIFSSEDWIGKPMHLARPDVVGEGFVKLLDEVYSSGSPFEGKDMRIVLRRCPDASEEVHYLDFVYAPILDDTGNVTGIFCEGFDVTSSHNAQMRARALAELGEHIRLVDDPEELAYTAAAILGRELNVSRAGYGAVDTKAETISINRDWVAPGIKTLAGILHFRDYGSYIEDLKRGETVIIADADLDPRTADRADALKAISAQSVVNMPVTETAGMVALLYLNHDAPRFWSKDEIDFVREVSELTRSAVERRRAEAELRANADQLRFLDKLGTEAASSVDADKIMEITTRLTGEHLGVSVCAYADMEADEDHFTIRGDWTAAGSHSIVGFYSLADFGEQAVRNLHAGLPLILNDNIAEIAPHEAKTFTDIGLRATICMPLVKAGRLTALMAVHDKNPRSWTARELALLKEVTERSWAHIERVRAQQHAQQTAERLRLATAAAAIGTWDYDPVGDVLNWDARCKELFGLPPDADVTYEATFLPGLHPDDRAYVHERVQAALNPLNPVPFDIEYRTIAPHDKVERWVAATGHAIVEDGRAARFVGTLIDVTARRRAENYFKTMNETGATVAAERDLTKIVQVITDAGVKLSGARFGAFFHNLIDDDGARYMLYTLSGAPRSAFENFPMPRNTAVFEPTFSGSGVVRADDILQDPRYGKNAPRKGMPEGHLPVRSYLAVPVIDRSGGVLGGLFFGHEEPAMFIAEHETALLGLAGLAATAIDNSRLFQALQALNETLEQRVREEVSERSRAEDQLRQVQKMEAVGQLTGGIAHDFNNMLAVVIGGINLLERKLTKGETDVATFVDGIRQAAQRAADLTNRLMTFARQQPLASKRLDPAAVVDGMYEMMTRTLGETFTVVVRNKATGSFVDVDPGQLENAILNLAVNARDAMPDGGQIVIETSVLSGGEDPSIRKRPDVVDYVTIAITDTGIGMTPDVIEKAFEPFYTTKGVGKGTGLGLSQVYGFARQSGGDVQIISSPGKGTTMKLLLPRADPPPVAATTGLEPAALSEGKAEEVILVVEDDESVRAMAVEAVAELGYTVLSAPNAEGALRIVDERPDIALLLSDVVMPGMSGVELAEEVRKRRPGLPVVLSTGYAPHVTNGVPASDRHVLKKPFTLDQLAEKLRASLDTRGSQLS